MIPSLIKFVSIDGLTRYEPHDGRHLEYRRRIGVAPLTAAREYNENELPVSMQASQRIYRLDDQVFDYEKGVLIEVYKERP